uniref:Uncharacterized protein n=1 Tax=Physcomitrium patens TaxID=3218 RepID=A0A2K1KTF9_PHYPA|nr:hypothetical protein PHYPA_004067 [Physcomitrium patens]
MIRLVSRCQDCVKPGKLCYRTSYTMEVISELLTGIANVFYAVSIRCGLWADINFFEKFPTRSVCVWGGLLKKR